MSCFFSNFFHAFSRKKEWERKNVIHITFTSPKQNYYDVFNICLRVCIYMGVWGFALSTVLYFDFTLFTYHDLLSSLVVYFDHNGGSLVTKPCPTLATLWTIQSWDSPGQNTIVGSVSLLQGIFPPQGSNPGLLHCRRILYLLSHKGSQTWVYAVSLFCVSLSGF